MGSLHLPYPREEDDLYGLEGSATLRGALARGVGNVNKRSHQDAFVYGMLAAVIMGIVAVLVAEASSAVAVAVSVAAATVCLTIVISYRTALLHAALVKRKERKEGSNLLLAFNPYMASLSVPGGSQNIPSVQVRVEGSNSE